MSLSKQTIKYLKNECDISLKNKKILITGSNSGVGFKTAETMLYLGASVVLACRNMDKANAAKEELLNDYPNSQIEVMKLDLSDLESVDSFADNIGDIDVIVNNAGVLKSLNKKTRQGLNLVIGTNYFGTYRLCERLIPKMLEFKHETILINTISIAHKITSIDLKTFTEERYGYRHSKLALAVYTYDLARKYEGTNLKIYMNHPGIAKTPIGSQLVGSLVKIEKYAPFNSAEKSSLSVAYILSHDLEEGSIVGPNKLFGGWGYPKVNKRLKKVEKGSKELIDFTEKTIKEIYK